MTGFFRITPARTCLRRILRRGIKKRRESIEMYAHAKRDELAAKESHEVTLLEQYLPAAVDPEAIRAAQVAKVYCARATRTVCETAVQVHGGIGNTWECLVHVYLRRALTSTELWPVTPKEIDFGLS